ARDRPPRLRCLCRRRQGRARHQRDADAVFEKGDRHGLPGRRAHGPGNEVEDDHPRPPRPRGRRADALLQETKMTYPADLKYTSDHEWIQIDGATARAGITDYAPKQLGDRGHLARPQVGRTLKKGEVFGTIESVKAVSELYSPVDGEITE